MKTVVVTGVTGMDGSHMVDYLLENTDCKVIGLVRRLSVKNWTNINHIDNEKFVIDECDITDPINVETIIQKYKPDYFINFAGCSFVGNSWAQPQNHLLTNSTAVLHMLEAIKKYSPHTRFYQAGSSEMFGDVKYSPQDEKHPFSPRSVYGVSKCTAHYLVKVFRESYNLFAISGVLFNHESPRRGSEFVPKKIVENVARIWNFKEKRPWDNELIPISLGNLNSVRDWSSAEDFVDGIWKMLNQHTPKEYVLSSGEAHTVKEFVEKSFKVLHIVGEWYGEAENEVYRDKKHILVKVDPKFYRPADVNTLLGDSSLARKELGWKPKISFDKLVEQMTRHEMLEIMNKS